MRTIAGMTGRQARTILGATGLAAACGLGIPLVAGAGREPSATAAATTVSVQRLPLGDGHVSTSGRRRGWVYACATMRGGGAFHDGSWIHSDGTFDLTAKPTVDGSVAWPGARVRISRRGGRVRISGNGLPVHATTGTFPIAASDDAYAYDRNPNSIGSRRVALTLPRARRAARAGCLPGGPVGYAINGVAIFDALDAQNRDALAHEIQDRCDGHPQRSGIYHYHSIPACLTRGARKGASTVVGWMLDGYPIVSEPGVTTARLDACHGRTSTITVFGHRVRTYHYTATADYPYTIGCFRGTALRPHRDGV